MVAYFPSLSDGLRAWAQAQPVFFIASAPRHGKHINVSPKGYTDGTFKILGPNLCAYVDRTGSGNESISHIYENGRATLMFCSFGSQPRIMRLFCRGRVIEWDSPEFGSFLSDTMKLDKVDAARAIIVLDIFKVQTSCGYAVPRIRRALGNLEDEHDSPAEDGTVDESSLNDRLRKEKADIGVAGFEERPTLKFFNSKREREGTAHDYQNEMNTSSLDGLPGLRAARRDTGENLPIADALNIIRGVFVGQKAGIVFGFLLAVLLQFLVTVFMYSRAETGGGSFMFLHIPR
ncbi:uncharacterized protein B0I36DRAFT_3482 [Microdochium trichocladiopsis]|uniref:Pyridoxamine 5'-phosphate oxidase N-terminal domain-containing protein n=1 Tax=Microdochium trichocladiopsis TaxID=1682393 RepID=A0A9P8YH63_9PEZI|nr:uncharacterized protein B0I36DRAFT_3482 [Microdochium trichocladiopsis]KAH7039922.1 hypothetical protein B0I36DRAFT_3482 [Microdochium trichocladiopsis]